MRRTHKSLVAAALLAGTCALAVPSLAPAASAHSRSASTTLRLADGTRIGRVEFSNKHGVTNVEVNLDVPEGRTPLRAFHGFHVHANDNAANGKGCVADPAQPSSTWFVSADGHLKSGTEVHGDHLGDMPPLHLNSNGEASAEFTVDRLPIEGLYDKVVILHAGPDNLGNVPTGTGPEQYTANSQAAVDKTANTGNAGDRVACGVIRTG
jgi:Cu-Zn family superoxide dismutase